MRWLSTINFTFLAAVFFCFPALALDIRIDFSTAGGSAGNNWNTLSAANLTGSTTSLIDHAAGAPTGITVTGTGWTTDYNAPMITLPSWWDGGTAAQDRIYFYDAGPQTGSVTLGGLLSSQAYQLELFSAGDYVDRVITANSSYGINSRTGLLDSAWHGADDGNYGWLIWDQLMPTAGGVVSISFDTTTSGYVNLNALRLTTVPEPSVLSLVGVGLLFYLRRRRSV